MTEMNYQTVDTSAYSSLIPSFSGSLLERTLLPRRVRDIPSPPLTLLPRQALSGKSKSMPIIKDLTFLPLVLKTPA
jgi:hypothetical protein